MTARFIGLLAMAIVAAGCGTTAAPTPQIIYVTPAPGSPSSALPSPTAEPTATPAPSTAAPSITPTTTVSASLAEAGRWEVSEIEPDPLTGKPKATALLRATSGKARSGLPIVLLIRCADDKTDVWISWRDFLDSDDRVVVTTRLGAGTASDDYWDNSTDKTSTFFPGSNENHIAYVKALLGESQLVARTTPYNESPVTAVFDLTGIDKAVAKIREACEW